MRCTNIRVNREPIGTDGEVKFRGGKVSFTQGTDGAGLNIATKQGGDLYLDSVPGKQIPDAFALEFQYAGGACSSKKAIYDRHRLHIIFS